jgi:hypothetical protein
MRRIQEDPRPPSFLDSPRNRGMVRSDYTAVKERTQVVLYSCLASNYGPTVIVPRFDQGAQQLRVQMLPEPHVARRDRTLLAQQKQHIASSLAKASSRRISPGSRGRDAYPTVVMPEIAGSGCTEANHVRFLRERNFLKNLKGMDPGGGQQVRGDAVS